MFLADVSPELRESILQQGVGAPPAGVEVHFGPDEHILNYERWVILIVTLGISAIFLALRLYTKIFVYKSVEIDDVPLVVGFFLFVAFQVVFFNSIEVGIGANTWNVQVWAFLEGVKSLNICAILYVSAAGAIKASILLQYITIFIPDRTQRRLFFMVICTALGMLTAFTIASVFICIWTCVPRESLWDPTVSGTCNIDISPWAKLNGVGNIALDVFVFALPVQATWRLQMNLRQKLSVCAVFSTGLFAIACSSVRTYFIWVYIDTIDLQRGFYFVAIWTIFEMTAGVVIANSFVIPHLLRSVIKVVKAYRARQKSCIEASEMTNSEHTLKEHHSGSSTDTKSLSTRSAGVVENTNLSLPRSERTGPESEVTPWVCEPVRKTHTGLRPL